MSRIHLEDFGDEPFSYAVRREPAHKVWLNRIGVTGTLFSIAMGASYVLGRPRR